MKLRNNFFRNRSPSLREQGEFVGSVSFLSNLLERVSMPQIHSDWIQPNILVKSATTSSSTSCKTCIQLLLIRQSESKQVAVPYLQAQLDQARCHDPMHDYHLMWTVSVLDAKSTLKATPYPTGPAHPERPPLKDEASYHPPKTHPHPAHKPPNPAPCSDSPGSDHTSGASSPAPRARSRKALPPTPGRRSSGNGTGDFVSPP